MVSQELQQYAAERFRERKPLLEPLLDRIEQTMECCTETERILMEYFYGTMPLRDAGEYEPETFLGYVRHGIWLRENEAWCQSLPEEIFLDYVLYYRINSEGITDCRRFFYEQICERIRGMEISEAALEVNYWCAEHVTYQAADERTLSPEAVYRSGKGRCGEESVFTVTALRSVGIPARQVYAPWWAHCDDNHAWVEVYLQGEWYFMGACEPEEVLNRGWFNGPSNRAPLVHSRTFSSYGKTGIAAERLIGKEGAVYYENRTSFYAQVQHLVITVKDKEGRPLPGAQVALEVLNMAEYAKAAWMVTDRDGRAAIDTGRGSVRIRAWKGSLFAERQVDAQKESHIELTLACGAGDTSWVKDCWEQAHYQVPEEHLIHSGAESEEQKERGQKRLMEASRHREQHFTALREERLEAAYPAEAERIRAAGENIGELRAFLEKDGNPDRERLLRTLPVKDYRDLKAQVLEDHLSCRNEDYPEEIFEQYVLCPRIHLEELTPYRKEIRARFRDSELENFARDPEEIWKYLDREIGYAPEEDYDTICGTPVGCLRLRQGNPLSKRILFVAICRTLNIPARLEPAELLPEYRSGGCFCRPKAFCTEEKAVCTLISAEGREDDWKYHQTWTIGRLEGTAFVTLHLDEIRFGQETPGICSLILKPGIYRVITSLRLPNGGQNASERIFCLRAGEEKKIRMELWEKEAPTEAGRAFVIADQILRDTQNEEVKLSALCEKGPLLLAVLDVGKEPTEHVLNELSEVFAGGGEEALPATVVLHNPEELANATLQKVLAAGSNLRVLFGGDGFAAQMADQMGLEQGRLPILAVLGADLAGAYASAGYNVGSIGVAANILKRWKNGSCGQ